MCRAFLSPVFEKSGWTEPEDENDKFVLYRFNAGVVSMNLPMIYQKSKRDGTEFFDELDYYMNLGRNINLKARSFLSKLKASCDPIMFMEGGFDGGNLKEDETIEPVLKYATSSIGYGGLNELCKLHNGKTLYEDQSFAIETMKHFNDNLAKFKEEDHVLWASYSTPGESWLSLACEQFIKEFGKIKGVTSDGFFTNSFHLHVSEDVTPIEKITIESQFFPYAKGGAICHVRIPSLNPEMNKGIEDIIRYSMSLGLYQSVNHASNICTDCNTKWIGDDSLPFEENYKCPNCGSMNTVGIRRIK